MGWWIESDRFRLILTLRGGGVPLRNNVKVLMERLSFTARCYYFIIILVAIVSTPIFLTLNPTQLTENRFAILFWGALYILSDYFESKIKLGRKDNVVLNITEAVTMFLVIVSGNIGLFVTFVGTFFADILNHRKLYSSIFNMAQRGIIYIVLSLIYIQFELLIPDFLMFVTLVLTHYIIDIAIVGNMIALATKQSWQKIYMTSYMNTVWIHAITLPTGIVMALLWSINPLYIVLSVGPLILALYGFRMIAELTTQNTLTTFLGLMVKMRSEDTEVSKR